MAIVQVSRITARKGLEVDLPQPLAGAELGWAVDERRLFIGNGTLAEGAPVVGNTEILTEFSDILSFATSYTYQGDAGGYAVQTGATPGSPVTQSLQSRLDSYAVITDFGPTGDGVTDVTADINRALYQIFCRQVNPQVRRSIFFPAGTYIISDTIKIPPYCKLYGEGGDSTIISFNVQAWTSTIPYAAGVLVEDSGTYYRSNAAVPIGTLITNATYWTVETLPAYIARTADSLQQVGVNIGTNGALPPGDVEVSGIKFLTNQNNDGVLIEAATCCYFDNVNIAGPGTTTTLTTATADTAAIRWNSTLSYVCNQIVWSNCKFTGFTYGTNTEEELQGITFSNNKFNTLYQGIVLGGASPVNGGPSGVRVVQNLFDNIYVQGVYIENVGMNALAYNAFYDVGNHFQGITNPATTIIEIDGENNVSVGDSFTRNTYYSSIYPCVGLNNNSSINLGQGTHGITYYQSGATVTTIANQLALGQYTREAGVYDILTDASSANLAVIDSAIPAFKIDYTITRDTVSRIGTITVVSSAVDSVGDLTYSDDYQENADTGITLTATQASPGGDITFGYAADSAGVDGAIRYSITHLG